MDDGEPPMALLCPNRFEESHLLFYLALAYSVSHRDAHMYSSDECSDVSDFDQKSDFFWVCARKAVD